MLNEIKKLKSIAEIGLLYAKDPYDRERYEAIRAISLDMMSQKTGIDERDLSTFFLKTTDYPTPKTDIRALVLNEKKEILMVKESTDGLWSLPGGWADIGVSPSEVAEKEVFEEAGLLVKAEKLLAIFDKRCHPHPAEAHYVYKMVFGCRLSPPSVSTLTSGFDILNAAFFDIKHLPPLSLPRILATQIECVYNKWCQEDWIPYFD